MGKKVMAWEISGIFFIFLLGSLLHFAFDLSGGLKAVALVAAVNESVWEHLKIGFWPAFIWAVLEFFVFGKKFGNFIAAKGMVFTLQAILITGIYYFTKAAGVENLAVDITNFFISIAISQVISYRFIILKKNYRVLFVLGMFLILFNLLAFSLFDLFPATS